MRHFWRHERWHRGSQFRFAPLGVAELPYMVVGSFASAVHGEPRTTQALEIVIDAQPASLDHFLAHIDMGSFYMDGDTARDALR